MSVRPVAHPPNSECSDACWLPRTPQPRLEQADIHVWRVDLSALDDRLCALLSEQERERAAAIVSERDRRLWSRSRGALRVLLGRYLQLDPGALSFLSGAYGKPALREVADRPAPCFSLSHSRGVALYAFSACDEVGVDVQLARPRSEGRRGSEDRLGLARRTFGDEAADSLRALAPQARDRAFLRLWTRYEAELKRLGVGIGGRRSPIDRHASWIAELDIGTDGAAAVACAWPARELRLWDFVE